MRRIEFTSPLARAVLPVVGGIAGFALLFGVTWMLANYSTSRREKQPETISQTFAIGPVKEIAKTVDQGGPILYPDLRDEIGRAHV